MRRKELIGQLEEQTQQGELILNSTHDGMIVIDREDKFIFLIKVQSIIGYKRRGDRKVYFRSHSN